MQVVDINGNMFGYDHLEIIGADGRPKTLDSGLTSVGLSMPSAFTVSNSPLTSNGTIGVTGAGTTSQYIDGTGSLRSFPSLTGYVPYIGATGNVDLGEYEIKAGQFEFDQTPSGAPGVAIMRWNDQDGTVDLGLKGGNVTLQIGQEQVTRVVNKTGVNLLEANYQTVRIDGAQGNRLKVDLAQANNDANSAETLGVVTETINDNQEGFITTSGLVRNINTTGSIQGETWADGDMLYLSGTVAGQLTNIKPTAPIHTVIMGYVVRAHATQGQIYVKVDNGYELDELHNVAISSPLNNQGLFYETATQLWKNKSIPTALGYTPVPDSRTLSINGTTYDLTANRTWNVGTVTAVTASSPLSSSGGTTPNLTILRATSTTDGYLTAIDWNTFNDKQPAGNYITALSGEASGSGPGTASVTLNNASVTAKVLTGVNITGGSINASDSILTAFGKLQNQINGLVGSSIYQGTWNAATNTPALASGVGTRGYYYIVNVAGSTNLDGITDWNVGDWAIFDGTAWQQVDNTDSVTSVNGQTGAVSLTTDNIPEGATNLYFTSLRARQSLSLTTSGSSGASTYNNTTGVLNVPNYTLSGLGGVPTSRTITINGTTYDLSSDRSWSVGTVTSVDMTVPTGLTVTGSPITGAGTLALGLQSGYSIPTTANQSNWTTAYNRSIVSAAVNYGVATTSLVLTQQNTGTVTASLIAGAASQGKFVFFNGTNLAYTSLNASAPLSFDLNTYTFSISQAGASTNGFLSSTDWNTFNNKQNAITLTTTGTSGPATLVGSTLNIPQYQSVLTNPVTGTGTANYVARWTSSSQIGTGVLYDNGTNVGIGTASPVGKLSVDGGDFRFNYGNAATGYYAWFNHNSNHDGGILLSRDNSTLDWQINNATGGNLWFYAYGLGAVALTMQRSNGFVGIGTTAPARILELSQAEPYLRFNPTAVSGAYLLGAADGKFYFTPESSYVATMTLSSGNVGIGTTSPNGKMTIIGNTLDIRNSSGGYGTGYGLEFSTNVNIPRIDLIDNGVYTGQIKSTSGEFILNNSSNNALTLGTNNTERMRITSAGNVGIGTNSPASYSGYRTLEVSSTEGSVLRLRNNSGSGVFEMAARSGDTYLLNSTNNPMWFGTNGSERMRITAAGNVGIGTTNPYSPLQVGSYTGSGGFSYGTAATFVSSFNSVRATLFVGSTDTTSTQDKGGSIDFGGGSEAGSTPYTYARIKGYKEVAGGGYSGYLSFSTTPAGSDANTERMRINSLGNVGIGTTSPGYKLDVNGAGRFLGDASSSAAAIFNNPTGAGGTAQYYTEFNAGATVIGRIFRGNGASGVVGNGLNIDNFDGFQVRVNQLGGSGGSINLLGGNVGIGTTSPNDFGGSFRVLDVKGNTGGYILSTNSDNSTIAQMGVGSNISYYGTRTNADVAITTNNTEKMRITSAGNVGIGSSNPANYSGYTTLEVAASTGGVFRLKNNAESGVFEMAAISANTYIKNVTSTPMWFGTANTERMRITSSGNVGVGTTSPGSLLTVEQDYTTTAEFGAFGQFSINGKTNANKKLAIGFNTATDVGFIQAMENGVSYKNLLLNARGGNVGIGTTSPQTTLDVNGNSYFRSDIRLGPNFIGPSTAILKWQSSSDSLGIFTWGDAKNIQIGGNNTIFATEAGSERMRITAGGEVYVGRTTNAAAGWQMAIKNGLTVTDGTYEVQMFGYFGAGIGTYTNHEFTFRTNNTERMRITSTGNLLVGTTTNLGADINANSSIRVGVAFGTKASIILGDSGTPYWEIFRPASSGNLRISSYALNAVEIQPTTGNVGIGTTSPAQKLSVVGEGSFTDTLSISKGASDTIQQGSSLYLIGGSGASYTQLQQGVGRFIIFGFNGSGWVERFTINNTTGNVGIGTTTPSQKLHVVGSRILVEDTNAGIMFRTGGTNRYSVASTGGEFLIYDEVNSTSRLYITSSGNVGIGTSSPSGNLQVFGSSPIVPAIFNLTHYAGVGAPLDFSFSADAFGNAGIGLSLSTNLTFSIAGSERMRIASNGDVGIGTTNPTNKLSVAGTMESLATSSVEGGQITLRSGSSYNYRWNIDNYADSFRIFREDDPNSANGYVAFFMDQVGTVGLNTTSPARSAILDLTATNRGFLPPRMTNTQMNNIASPATGLIVYDTTNNKVTVYNGSGWVPLH